MKLEVGMYVRTKDGYVSQYRYYDTTNMGKLLCIPLSNRTFANIEDIIKASHNIIDLIEVGDYVNGYYVEDVLKTFVNVAVGSNYFQSPTIYEKNIKSIVTKEQFENIEVNI
jgi:hypothetical protein